MARKTADKKPKKSVAKTEASQVAPYVVLARKYRPQTFKDLIGQDAMVATLKNAFATGRIAQGYMLTGVRGVGKTTTARILARALNFEPADSDAGPQASGPTVDMPELGRHCAEIMQSRHTDVIEMDAASNTGVDNIREIIESARYKPLVARYKVFIIDEVHMLSKGAFNALLKTLEEPPEHVKFIFATTEIRKVPVTVLSRCQRFDLRRVDVPLLTSHFENIVNAEGAKAEPEALALIARAAEGSVRDGLSILDQAIAFSKGKVATDDVRAMLGLADSGRVFDLLESLFSGQAGPAVEALEALVRDGAEPVQVLSDLAEAVHIATRHKAVGAEAVGDGLSAEQKRRAGAISDAVSVPFLGRAWQVLLKGIAEADRAPNPQTAAEMVLIRLAYTADLPTPDAVIKALGGGGQNRTGSGSSGGGASQGLQPAGKSEPAPVLSQAAGEHSKTISNTKAGKPASLSRKTQEAAAPDKAGPAPSNQPEGTLATFEDLIEFVGEKRDAKLRVHLEDHVSVVNYDGAAQTIDLFLLPGAPTELANELRENLNAWTNSRWMIALSGTPGARAVGDVRREREAAEREVVGKHPAIKAVFDVFPDAEISEIRPVTGKDVPTKAVTSNTDDDSKTG
ncbi:MAG: DNA polymerase III subunit gamma/tau [Hyphomicrobiaceae bacterium]